MKKQKTIKAWVYFKGFNTIRWGWWCYPFLNVKMTGETKTPNGAKRAAKRTIEKLNCKAEIEILWPSISLKEAQCN